MVTAENSKYNVLSWNIKNGAFRIDKFCSQHIKTFHITESISECEQVQSITLTCWFLEIEIWVTFNGLFPWMQNFAWFRDYLFLSKYTIQEYCIWFLRRKMLDPVLDPVPKSCLALRFFLQTAKYFAKFELNVNCLNNFLELFSKSSRTH